MLGVALVAGAEPATAARLGVSMTALQASIGALNDVLDAPTDAGHKPGKPIPAGALSADQGRAVVVLAAGLGLALAAASGTGLLVLAGIVLSIGFAYDLWAKGTAWSWLPFAVGIPILPVYGWYGAVGTLADWFVVVVPAAMLAGASLAIANSRADLERDRSAGISSVADRLGEGRAWWVHAIGLGLVTIIAVGWLAGASGNGTTPEGAALAAVAIGVVVIVAGILVGRAPDAGRRERGWELEAIGVAVLALGWLWIVAA